MTVKDASRAALMAAIRNPGIQLRKVCSISIITYVHFPNFTTCIQELTYPVATLFQ